LSVTKPERARTRRPRGQDRDAALAFKRAGVPRPTGTSRNFGGTYRSLGNDPRLGAVPADVGERRTESATAGTRDPRVTWRPTIPMRPADSANVRNRRHQFFAVQRMHGDPGAADGTDRHGRDHQLRYANSIARAAS